MRFGKIEIGISIATIFCIVAVLGVFIPNYLTRERRVDALLTRASVLKMSLQITYLSKSAAAPKPGVRSETWQIQNIGGVTTEHYTVASESLSETVTLPSKRTVASAELYDGLLSAHIWNVGDEIDACPKTAALVCYTFDIDVTDGPAHHRRTLTFDDLEITQDPQREFHITLDEQKSTESQLSVISRQLSMRARYARNPDYAHLIQAFREYGDSAFQYDIEKARTAVTLPKPASQH
jgi:hypothetical protein